MNWTASTQKIAKQTDTHKHKVNFIVQSIFNRAFCAYVHFAKASLLLMRWELDSLSVLKFPADSGSPGYSKVLVNDNSFKSTGMHGVRHCQWRSIFDYLWSISRGRIVKEQAQADFYSMATKYFAIERLSECWRDNLIFESFWQKSCHLFIHQKKPRQYHWTKYRYLS